MCTKTNKVTVEAVPLLKENETQDQEWNRVAHASKQILSVQKVPVSDPCVDLLELQTHRAPQQTKCPRLQGLVTWHHPLY